MTRSDRAAASRSAAVIASGSSTTMPVTSVSQPASRACAASISELVSGISPGRRSLPIGRISSPVGTTTTRGARRTSSSTTPAAALAAASTGRSRCPSGSSSSVALMSSPIVRTCWYGGTAARTSAPAPVWWTSSRMITAS